MSLNYSDFLYESSGNLAHNAQLCKPLYKNNNQSKINSSLIIIFIYNKVKLILFK